MISRGLCCKRECVLVLYALLFEYRYCRWARSPLLGYWYSNAAVPATGIHYFTRIPHDSFSLSLTG